MNRHNLLKPVWVDPHWPLSTDLYEISMTIGYWAYEMFFPATFELSFRHLPEHRGYLIAAGIETAIEYCLQLHFDDDSIEYLASLPAFQQVPHAFWDWLKNYRFHGDIDAVPEGTPVFAREPVLVVRGPLPEVQLLETFLLSTVNFQTMVATKAARIVDAARGRGVVDFGLRRAHSPEAGFWAARAAYIGGCIGTSNLLAGFRFGIPVYGTAAHSWTLANPSEEEAFRRFQQLFPDNAIFLVDTFDTIEGVRRAIKVGRPIRAIRIDSGNLEQLTRKARRLLDEAGLQDVKIILSGDLNEYRIDELLRHETPVDLFGVGTELVVSRDAPAMTGIYKLVEWEKDGERIPRMKWSPDKMTLPGRKQVFRVRNDDGMIIEDRMTLFEEADAAGEPLLVPWVRNGARIREIESLDIIQQRATKERHCLPETALQLSHPQPIPVHLSAALEKLIDTLVH